MEKIDIADIFAADAETLYNAWLDSQTHSAMTGSNANVSADVGGTFSIWNGYATGENLTLQSPSLIVQKWRSEDFPADAPSSTLTISFESTHDGNTRVRLVHEDLPDGTGTEYAKGWAQFYFVPMHRHFRKKTATVDYGAAPVAADPKKYAVQAKKKPKAAAKKAAPKKAVKKAAPKKAAKQAAPKKAAKKVAKKAAKKAVKKAAKVTKKAAKKPAKKARSKK